MDNFWIDILGWIGSIILVAAYWLNSKGRINAQTFLYQGMNIGASILLMVNTIYYGAYPSSAVNIIWIVIGAFYLSKISKNEQKVH